MWAGILKIITSIVSGFLAPLALWWIKQNWNSDEENGLTIKVQDELESIRQEIMADRIWIAQFHNGSKHLESIRNESMKKVSIIYEKTGTGVSEEKDKLSNVLVSFFSEMIARISADGHVRYEKAQMDVDPEVELLFRQRGTEKMHLFAMRDIDGILIGIMGIDYTDTSKALSENSIQYLNAKASLLAGYISYRNMKNKNE